MGQCLHIHPENPQGRLIAQAVAMVRSGGVIIYPTDSCYALGCRIGDKHALDEIRALRGLGQRHHFTLLCRDLSDLSNYAQVDNWAYRLLKANTPGPYTFILKATREVPRRLQHPKRKTIGLRIPDHPITQAMLEVLGEPLMTTSLQLAGEDLPMSDPDIIEARMAKQVDMIVNGGAGGLESTTVVDLHNSEVELLRVGCGDPTPFE